MKCIYFQKSINSLSLSFHWSFHAFHKCALFISQVVRLTANLSNCALLRRFFFCIFWVFVPLCLKAPSENASRTIFLLQRLGLLQVPSQLNDDSLLKIFFERFIMKLHTIVIPNKQTNTKVTRLAKKYFKTQSNTFLIKLKCSEVFRENWSFELSIAATIRKLA